MKTKELISKLNGMPNIESFTVNLGIDVYNFDGKKLGWVSVDDFGTVDTSYEDIDTMKNKNEIVKLLFEYALTPLSEREDEPKFRVKMLPNELSFLNFSKCNGDCFVDDGRVIPNIQTILTKSEYDKLQQKYSKWLPKFDKKDSHFEFLEADK